MGVKQDMLPLILRLRHLRSPPASSAPRGFILLWLVLRRVLLVPWGSTVLGATTFPSAALPSLPVLPPAKVRSR